MNGLYLESIKLVSSIILIIIHQNISCCNLKQISSLSLSFTKECILDLPTLFYERLIKTFFCFRGFSLPDGLEWVDVRDKCNFRAGCIEQIHCGYMYIRVRVPRKKKTWGIPGTDIYFILSIKQILDRIKWGAPFIIIKQSVFVTGRVGSHAGLSGL